MSTTRVLTRLGIAAGAVLLVLSVAAPAFAADAVEASISGLPSTFTAGANRADNFRTALKNNTDTEIFPIRRIIAIKLTGLKPENVRIFQGAFPLTVSSAGQDTVRAADLLLIRLGAHGKNNDEVRQDFAILFAQGAPNGRAEVAFQAYRNNQFLGGTSKTVTVKGGVAQPSADPTRTPSPGPTQEQVLPGTQSGITVPVSPLAGAANPAATDSASTSSIPAIFYILGAILVAAGGGILWLLFRPRPALVADYPTGSYVPVRAPSHSPTERAPTLGYPTASSPLPTRPAHIQPTTVMPTMRGGSDGTPPPVDPWATQGGASDPTRGFGSRD